MSDLLKPCPCGQTPTALSITPTQTSTLTFAEIEECFPEGGHSNDDGSVTVSAQRLHDFAHAIRECRSKRKETTVVTDYKLRDDFESWVKNPCMLNRSTEPGYTDEYEHPWTRGAWAAWKECHERAKPAAVEAPQITREQWEDATRGLGTKA